MEFQWIELLVQKTEQSRGEETFRKDFGLENNELGYEHSGKNGIFKGETKSFATFS